MDDSFFAVLGLLSKSSKSEESNESTLHGVDGIILLFNVEDPVPVTTWFVRKVSAYFYSPCYIEWSIIVRFRQSVDIWVGVFVEL